MKSIFGIDQALAAGVIAGVAVLGIFGRIAFSVLAAVARQPLNFGVVGVFEVLIISALVGAIGGGLFLLLSEKTRFTGIVSGMFAGLSLFVLSVVVSSAIGFLHWGTPVVLLTVFIAGLIFVIYGIGTNLLAKWFGVNPKKNP